MPENINFRYNGVSSRRFFMNMNLIIDIGNTRAKMAFFHENDLVEKAILDNLTLDALSTYLNGHTIEGVIMSVTGYDTEGVAKMLSEKYFFIQLNHHTSIPIQNLYGTPETLGKDRLAAVIAAQYLRPNENCLVIDSGTCITYNFLSKTGQFLGGNIAPGLNMRLKAMHHFTANLPLIDRSSFKNVIVTASGAWQEGDVTDLIGKSTIQAMLNGAQIGLLAEVEGFAQRFQKQFGDIQVIITGGDGVFLNKNLSIEKIYFEPNLVLIGLNRILNFNKK